MKKNFIIVVLSLLVGLVMGSITSPVFADSSHQDSNPLVTTSLYLLETEEEADSLSPQPRSVCVKCSSLAWMECKGDLTLLGTSTHNSLSGKCTVKYYRSGTRIKCYSCGYSNTTAITGRHDCYEIHSKCSKGTYKVCPVQPL